MPEAEPAAADLAPAERRQAVEAILFAAAKPVPLARLAECLGLDEDYLGGLLAGLAERWRQERRGWVLAEIAGGWQLLSAPEAHPWVRRYDGRQLPERLSRAALETLAVIAYRQPVTRGAIEDIRGVQCGPVLRQLLELKLIEVVGRDEQALGRPLLYGTTAAFLQRFGLARLEDLPRPHELGLSPPAGAAGPVPPAPAAP